MATSLLTPSAARLSGLSKSLKGEVHHKILAAALLFVVPVVVPARRKEAAR
jgi:hypothetical protein